MIKTMKILGDIVKETVGEGTERFKKRIDLEKVKQYESNMAKKDAIGNEILALKKEIEELDWVIEELHKKETENYEVNVEGLAVLVKLDTIIEQYVCQREEINQERERKNKEFFKLSRLLESDTEMKGRLEESVENGRSLFHAVKIPTKGNATKLIIHELYESLEFLQEGKIYRTENEQYSFEIYHKNGTLECLYNNLAFNINSQTSRHQLADIGSNDPILLARGESRDIEELRWFVPFSEEYKTALYEFYRILRYELSNIPTPSV